MNSQDVINGLGEVMDPELGLNIVDLGLIEKLEISPAGEIRISLIMTTRACPQSEWIKSQVIQKLEKLCGSGKQLQVEILNEPKWSKSRISEKGKKKLGLV